MDRRIHLILYSYTKKKKNEHPSTKPHIIKKHRKIAVQHLAVQSFHKFFNKHVKHGGNVIHSQKSKIGNRLHKAFRMEKINTFLYKQFMLKTKFSKLFTSVVFVTELYPK